ncbi:hypothetical protein SERLA73DRAFT_173674 [Serpula lacrymans var. lacrymans S7.3]|uniref:Uncharacterized protein n=2 Tax=Serpula lacrymans var. lacrymans TaxID=341189 RepID=F8PFC3_SERL3|nr:uncharacterized protein SERLADRAFT_454483 [Serpula lacrymans var. lacrymans S7.9]EGO04229.1 hypothetical protein SERLA73DRAFT_173674 [Serpula lacrymans var. lacrymans S7.3]EGO30168.1 hypothetical protein SERLADRAFT_454483 [Serpula lacrymans var. lacrymans S7.9]
MYSSAPISVTKTNEIPNFEATQHEQAKVLSQECAIHPLNKEVQSQMEQSLKRSVTLIIWYKAHCDPIRLNHDVSTFPLFQLSHYPSLVSDLELSPHSYIDTFNSQTSHWEQHLMTTVRVIDRDQRLLYKIRKSLMNGFAEDECPGLKDEVAMQSRSTQGSPLGTSSASSPSNPLKRPAEDIPETAPPHKMCITEGYLTQPSYLANMNHISMLPNSGYPQDLSQPVASSSSSRSPKVESPANSTAYYHNSLISPGKGLPPGEPGSLPAHFSLSANNSTSIPYHPHPPLKRWPNDYSVSEVAVGFRQMDSLISQTPTVTQKAAFERVFGCRYVKSTVCRHRGVWRRADIPIKNLYEAMGTDERAVWGEFVRRVEGRPPGKAGHLEEAMGHPMNPRTMQSATSTSANNDQRSPRQRESGEEQLVGCLGRPPDVDVHPNIQSKGESNGMPPNHGVVDAVCIPVYDPSPAGADPDPSPQVSR